VGDAIFATLDRISSNPMSFKECEEIPTKGKIYRRAICLSWNIIYKIKENEILVLGIIHKSRKPSALKVLRRIN
jgi:plasmid stabilization system protein ParE